MEIIKYGSMETVKQNSKGVNTRKCNFVMKRFYGGAIPHGIAGVHGYKSIVVPMQTNIVVPAQVNIVAPTRTGIVVRTYASTVVQTQISTVVQSCCRMAMRVYFGRDARRQTNREVRKCICKSIFIHILKDSKQ